MRVAVVGSGNGGVATAFDFAHHGHEVALFSPADHPANIDAVAEAGGISASGDLEGFAPVVYAGHDAAQALAGADLVMLVGPAYATESLTEAIRDHLQPGMAVVICPTSTSGSIVFKKVAGLPLTDESILVGETSTLPYAVRVTQPGTVRVFLKLRAGLYLAGLPRSGTDRLYEMLHGVYPAVEKAESVFQTTLQNGNPVIHPAVTILNAGLIERTHGAFLFYEEGVTEAVGRLIEAVDLERLAIASAMGVRVLSEPELGSAQGYMEELNYSTGYSTAPGFLGIGAQHQLDNRYLTEDVGYGLVFLTDLARRIGVPTPAMDSVITIAGVLLARDFRAEGTRTLATLGLDGLSPAELAAL
ncbi:MAG: NAD/NADP octopine/nopaline dehydrogenase family protein [Nocardioides sp.]|uniref:NAD/NADP octopine/nopaline dehydrogenase family protein n=1 Tax=Nocardioides sp. TaxID=35761 RepID=UPI0039E4AE88